MISAIDWYIMAVIYVQHERNHTAAVAVWQIYVLRPVWMRTKDSKLWILLSKIYSVIYWALGCCLRGFKLRYWDIKVKMQGNCPRDCLEMSGLVG